MAHASIRRFSQQHVLTFLVALAVIFFLATRSGPQSFDVVNISISDAKTLVDQGALVIDVRETDKYAHRHIPGAITLPLSVLRMGIPEAIAYAKDRPVVVYCGDGVSTGPEGTAILNKAGFAGAVNVGPGIEGWAKQGLPVQHGLTPKT